MTDASLPGMSGLDLAHRAAALQALQVMIASGHAELEGAPPDSLLLDKPFGTDQIAKVLLAAGRALHARSTGVVERGVESS
ncbi:MAG: hypothetical protein JWQ11_3887 [Rhizobacter sp.]|nr:hypothetical protein [Rhizobacter sp.]